MSSILYAIRLGVVDAFGYPMRLIIALITTGFAMIAVLEGGSLLQDTAAVSTRIHQLAQDNATSFKLIYPDDAAIGDFNWPPAPLDGLLRSALEVDGTASAMLWDYAESPYEGRLFVLVGSWPQYWSFAQLPGSSGLIIGSDVSDLQVGQTVDLGPHKETVLGRMPRGVTLLQSLYAWEVPEDLDGYIVFLTSYAHYEDSFNPDLKSHMNTGMEQLMDSLTVNDWDSQEVQRFMAATAESVRWRLLPRPESSETNMAVLANVQANMMLLAAWIVLSLTALVAMLAHGIQQSMTNLGVHRLCGAPLSAIRIRLSTFVSLSFLLPAIVMWYVFPVVWPRPEWPSLQPHLWWVLPACVAIAAVTVEVATRVVARQALLLATKSVE